MPHNVSSARSEVAAGRDLRAPLAAAIREVVDLSGGRERGVPAAGVPHHRLGSDATPRPIIAPRGALHLRYQLVQPVRVELFGSIGPGAVCGDADARGDSGVILD